MPEVKTYDQLANEVEELRAQLEDANDALEAIRTGKVDALVISDESGHQLYTLRSADQTYRVFIENMNEGAVTLNKEGVILYANPQFASMIQMPLSNLVGSFFADLIPPKNRAIFLLLFQEGWKRETKGEHQLMTASGATIPFLLSLKTLQLAEGTALSMILTDLTGQKENEALLKIRNDQLKDANRRAEMLNDALEKKVEDRTRDLLESREHFKFLADHLPVKVWTAKPDGSIDYFNQRWYSYTGSTFEECAGWKWKKMVHPEDLEPMLHEWHHSLSTGEPFKFEYRLKRQHDESFRWHIRHALPFRDNEGKVVAWFGISTDIEDQKKAMEKKDEFISVVSHELKTPLTSVKAYIQLMQNYKKESLPPAITQYINKAEEHVRKLEHIIRDLMDVSKIQAGKLEFNLSEMRLMPLVSSCAENSQLLFPEFNIEISSDQDLVIAGNYERLEQVIMNLINNAVKYSPTNNKIVIGLHRIDGHARITVTDFGIGLSDEDKELIFQRFYRVNSVKYFYSGLGMGLYISSEIVKAHNGRMGVESRLNEGSAFYFDLPLNYNN